MIEQKPDAAGAIRPADLEAWQTRFDGCRRNRAVAPALARVGIAEASLDSAVYRRHPFSFSLETKHGEITNQKSTGRCWMFAALNTARVETMRRLDVETFEFSEAYAFFWDKLEKSNTFLEAILATLDEPRDGRLIAHLLSNPVQDGGQWDMFAGLLAKYGAVPKAVMPETFHSSNSGMLTSVLTTKLREYACRLRREHEAGSGIEDLRAAKDEMLYFVYQLLVKTLGEPPKQFDFAYRDRDKQYHRIEGITPQAFFRDYVGWELDEHISLINAPTDDKPYGRCYTVRFLASVHEGRPIRYINVPSEALKQAAIRALQDGKPVWFGCDVGKFLVRDAGIMDERAYLYEDTLGEGFSMTKAERLDYGESLLTHAMVFTGVDLDDGGRPVSWRVENSWGEKTGTKGFYSMSDAWFDEFNYQVMVERRYIDEEWLAALDEPVIELEPWDPMGALATLH